MAERSTFPPGTAALSPRGPFGSTNATEHTGQLKPGRRYRIYNTPKLS